MHGDDTAVERVGRELDKPRSVSRVCVHAPVRWPGVASSTGTGASASRW